jgi:phage/conjugal plasmid C-4 type zinc finger TraR family protein
VNTFGNFAVELAEKRVAQERDASVARAQDSLGVVSNATHCASCGEEIPEGRRLAMPAARDCIDCATGKEAGKR